MDILFSELKKKDVIDVCSGKKLGKITDLKFDFPFGKIKSFSVRGGMFCDEVTVPLPQVERIGEDIVLVNLAVGDGVCDNSTDSPCEKPDNNPERKPDCKPNRRHDAPFGKPSRLNPRDLHFDEDE